MRRTWILGAVLAVAAVAHADDWPNPTTKYLKSDSGRFRAVVVPGASGKAGQITLFDDRDPTKPKKLYQRRPVNQEAPVKILLSDGGQLVTLDEWGNAGYKHSLVIYDRKGKVVVDCALEHILLPDELAAVKITKSSRWWRAEETGDFWLDQAAANIKIAAGPVLRFDLARGVQTRDGQRVIIPGSDRCRPRKGT